MNTYLDMTMHHDYDFDQSAEQMPLARRGCLDLERERGTRTRHGGVITGMISHK